VLRKQHWDMAKILIEKGGNRLKHAVGRSSWTLMHYIASLRGVDSYVVSESLRIMIALPDEFPINKIDKKGWTALHLAVKKGNIVLINVLLGFDNVDINAENSKSETPVIMCLLKNQNTIAKSFCSRLAKGGKGTTISQKKGGKRNYVQRLFHTVIDDLRPNQKNKLFLSFILEDLLGPLEWFVAHSPLIHKSLDEDGWGGLHLAARENKLNMIQFLLATNRSNLIDLENAPNGNSPLHLFVRNQPPPEEENFFTLMFDEMVSYMKNHKVSDNPIELKNKDGETPLHAACLKSNLFCIKLLLKKGANICAQSSNGESPLHYGVRFFSVDLMQNIITTVQMETLCRAMTLVGVEGTLKEVAQKYNPPLLPLLDTIKK